MHKPQTHQECKLTVTYILNIWNIKYHFCVNKYTDLTRKLCSFIHLDHDATQAVELTILSFHKVLQGFVGLYILVSPRHRLMYIFTF